MFWAGQRAPYGSVLLFLIRIRHSLLAKLSVPPSLAPWSSSPCFSFVRCHLSQHGFLYTRMFGQKSAHCYSSLLSPLHILSCWPDSVSVDYNLYANDSNSNCCALASFQLLHTRWASSLGPTSISHSSLKPNICLPLPSVISYQGLSELMASLAFLYCPSENPSFDSFLSIGSWYPIIKSIHFISTIILPTISSLPFPFVLSLFFTFYPDSYVNK